MNGLPLPLMPVSRAPDQYKYPLLAKIATPPQRPAVDIAGLTAYSKKTPTKWRIYWLLWIFGMVLTGFLVPELHALFNKQPGDTLSENIRYWLHPDTPGGGAAWLSIIVTLMGVLVWLFGHIHEYWP